MAGTQATLTALPSELIRGIISKILRPKDLLDLALVSKKLHDEVMPCLWEKVMLLPKSRWEIRAKTMDVDEVERLTANDTRERPNIEPIVNHLLNAPQSSRAHIRNLTLYSRYHEVYENSAGALDRLCSGLVGNTLTCLRIDEPYQLHFDTLRMLLRSQSKLKTLQLGLLDGDMPAQEALLQCASAGDCQGTRGSLEKLIIFVAESDPHSPGARSVSPLGAAFPRLTSLSLLFSSIYTGVFYGNIGNSIFIDNLTKLVLDRLEFNFELYASDSDFWNGFKATNLVSLKIRSCCQPENLLTKLTKLFQTPGFVSKLTKLEFTTTSVEGGHQIPAFNNFLSSFKGLTKLFVFSNEALPWEGVSNHAATLESLNLVVPDPVGIFCQARHIETLFSRCHNLQRLAMPIPDCTTIDFVPASTSEFWGYMLALRHLTELKVLGCSIQPFEFSSEENDTTTVNELAENMMGVVRGDRPLEDTKGFDGSGAQALHVVRIGHLSGTDDALPLYIDPRDPQFEEEVSSFRMAAYFIRDIRALPELRPTAPLERYDYADMLRKWPSETKFLAYGAVDTYDVGDLVELKDSRMNHNHRRHFDLEIETAHAQYDAETKRNTR